MKVDSSSGFGNKELVWLNRSEAVSSCQCPFGRVQVNLTVAHYLVDVHRGGLTNTVTLPVVQGLEFQLGDEGMDLLTCWEGIS